MGTLTVQQNMSVRTKGLQKTVLFYWLYLQFVSPKIARSIKRFFSDAIEVSSYGCQDFLFRAEKDAFEKVLKQAHTFNQFVILMCANQAPELQKKVFEAAKTAYFTSNDQRHVLILDLWDKKLNR